MRLSEDTNERRRLPMMVFLGRRRTRTDLALRLGDAVAVEAEVARALYGERAGACVPIASLRPHAARR